MIKVRVDVRKGLKGGPLTQSSYEKQLTEAPSSLIQNLKDWTQRRIMREMGSFEFHF